MLCKRGLCRHSVCVSVTLVHLLCPRPVGGGALGGHARPSSVCLSDVAYISSNSKTKRPRKTKFCTGVPQVTCDSHTDHRLQGQQVKSQGNGAGAYCGGHLSRTACFRDKARYWSKTVIFSYPLVFDALVRGIPVGILLCRLA